MAKTGRPRKPTFLKVLEGNRGHRPIDLDSEPQPERKAPSCPRHIKGDARKMWRYVVKLLTSLGPVLCAADAILIQIIVTHMMYRNKLEGELTPERAATLFGNEGGYPFIDPRLYQIKKEDEFITKLLSECGMTPAARTRIKVEPKKKLDAFELYRRKRVS